MPANDDGQIRKTVRILLFLLLLGAGCSSSVEPASIPTAEYLMRKPNQIPDFLSVDPVPGQSTTSNKVCIIVQYYTLWETGDSEMKIVNNFHSHIKPTVDGRNLVIDAAAPLYSGPVVLIKNEKGEKQGEIGTFEPCFRANLGSGLHLATVTVTTTSGVEHSYTWAFSR